MDLAIITDDWPFDENVEANNIRKIVGVDGRIKLQLRLRDGVIQWELEGRPDGTRPYGFDSVLDYCRFLVGKRAQGRDRTSVRLDDPLIEELEEELVDYSRRLAALLRIGDYDHARLDARHGLAVLGLVRAHGRDRNVAFECDRYRPQLISDRARAEALLASQHEHWLEAMAALNNGILEIEGYLAETSRSSEAVQNPQRQGLVELRRSLRERYNIPLTDEELLQSLQAEQQVAIQKEDFLMAGRLRDKIRIIRQRLGPAS